MKIVADYKNHRLVFAECLSAGSNRRRHLFSNFVIALLGIIYFGSFTDFYLTFFSYLPSSLYELSLRYIPSLKTVTEEMIAQGDVELHEKYVIFSILKYILMLIVVTGTFIITKVRKRHALFKYSFLKLFVISSFSTVLFVFISYFNKAGYENAGVGIPLIRPTLGLGELHFIRDIFILAATLWCVDQSITISRIVATKHLMNK